MRTTNRDTNEHIHSSRIISIKRYNTCFRMCRNSSAEHEAICVYAYVCILCSRVLRLFDRIFVNIYIILCPYNTVSVILNLYVLYLRSYGMIIFELGMCKCYFWFVELNMRHDSVRCFRHISSSFFLASVLFLISLMLWLLNCRWNHWNIKSEFRPRMPSAENKFFIQSRFYLKKHNICLPILSLLTD